MKFERTESGFVSHGVACAAWLYTPHAIERPAVIVMAHGFGGERSFGLAAYAERFASEGLACLVFDYRTFGESQGNPRNYIHPQRQLEDWQAAIKHARALQSVDGQRLALWSTSFGAGHTLVTAARDPNIRAIVAQLPFLDGRAANRDLSYKIQAVYHGLRDMLGAALTGRRHYVPIVGSPSTFAMLNTPGCLEGARRLRPPGAPSGRRCPAEIALRSYFYRPIEYVSKVECPALLLYAESDNLIPPRLVERACALMQNARCVKLPVEHFDVYFGESFETSVRLELEFLKRELKAPPPQRNDE